MRKLSNLLLLVLLLNNINVAISRSTDESQKPLPLNKEVRFGKLANGLTYYIQHNTKPENRVEFRLAVNAGSNQEEVTQKGLAHFVEHMAFNGSTHFSKNELVNYLEGIGTKFGAHLNAYTSFDETVYMLQLPTDKKEILDKGLNVLEDWAGGLSFDTTEINKERGVVFSEWRSGLGAGKRMMEKYLPVLYYKSRYAERLPIGDTAILLHAPYERFTSFYKTWYRPNLMAVVIVGDINVDEMESEIKKRFSSLKNPENEIPKQIYKLPEHKELLVSICTDPEATYSRANIVYKHPAEEENSVEGFKKHLMNSLLNNMLNNRLQELMQQPEPPFFAAYSGYERETRANDAFNLTAVAKSGQTVDALYVLLTENERVLRYGFTQTELDRQKLELLTSYENAVNEKDKTESSSLVSEYVSHFLSNVPAPGIEFEAAFAKKILPFISLKEINALPEKYITDKNCVIILTAPESEKKFLPWENDIKDLAVKIKTADIKPYEDKTVNEPLMAEKPKSSNIVKETKNEKLEITTLELKNGVRILLKPTTFKNDEILMTAYSPGGTSLYPDSAYMSADYSNAVIIESGISKFDKLTLQKLLTGKTAGVYPYVAELNEGFNGSSNQKDLETMLQLTYLYFTQPRKSVDDFKTFMSKEKSQNEHLLDNPGAYFAHKFQQIIFNKNIRRGLTTIDKLNMVNFEDAFKIYQERFKDASDFTFIFVGNFEVDKIKPLLETYLGGLPSNGQKESWKDPAIEKREGLVVSRIQMGKTQKDLVGIHFHGQTNWTEEENYVFNSMIKVLNIQLREALREDKGGVYGVGVNGGFSQRPKNAYGINIQFNTEPKRVDELIKTVYENIDSLKNNLVSEEKIIKVKETQRREREMDLKENDFWLNVLQYYDEYGKDIQLLFDYDKQIDGLTAQKIKDAFKKYFDISNHVEVVLEPEK
jgi:zinc protease